MKNFDSKIKLVRAIRFFTSLGALSCMIALAIIPAYWEVLGFTTILLLWFAVLSNNLYLRWAIKKAREEVESLFKEYKKEGNE